MSSRPLTTNSIKRTLYGYFPLYHYVIYIYGIFILNLFFKAGVLHDFSTAHLNMLVLQTFSPFNLK